LERDEELARLGDALDAAAAGNGGVVVVSGLAGLGKTKLLEAAPRVAAEGTRTLLARASELEAGFAFGVVRQLLEPPVLAAPEAERARLLDGAARHAAAVLEIDPDAAPGRDLHQTLHGLYWLLVNLSADAPLLVAVDDLQWADEASLRWLAYLVNRLERLPIAVVVTIRTDAGRRVELPPGAGELRREAVEAIHGLRAVRVEPQPLSAMAVGAVLGRCLGTVSDAAFAEACHRHTGGNPFLLTEIATELAVQQVSPSSENVSMLSGIVPERVSEMIRRRLARLTRHATQLAGALAVLGEGSELTDAAKLAGLDVERAGEAAGELGAAQILDDARAPRFRHPLLRSAVLADIPELERARAHGAAARLLADRGAPHGRVAAHLLASNGAHDAWAVDQLRAAARTAAAQGVPEQAAALLRRALAEPPQGSLRPEILRELASAALAALEPDAAEWIEAALEVTTKRRARAELALQMGATEIYDATGGGRAVDVLFEVIEEVRDEPDRREQWLRLEAMLAIVGRYDLRTEPRVRGRIQRLAGSLFGDTPGELIVQAAAAAERQGPRAVDLARAGRLREEAVRASAWPDPGAHVWTILAYVFAQRPDAARALADRVLGEAASNGSPMGHAIALLGYAMVAHDLGDLRSAEEDLTRSLELRSDPRAGSNVVAGLLVQTLVARGRHEAAEEVLHRQHATGELAERMLNEHLLFGRGLLRGAQERWDEAEADFREIGRRHQVWGLTRPAHPWRSACARVRLAVGDREGARELAAAELELARTWDTPKAIAIATHARALTAGGDEAIDGLAAAVALLEGTPWKLDRAEARCDLGSALRRAGRRREAREALTNAMDEAHACGAEPLAERAADELRATGARPRRRALYGVDALTPSELRVATLAASGQTNRAIAQQLFVTPATVETHLTRVYRKLELDGRAGLAGALVAGAR
jgi:DNA-binding CsgD family transcriptional regulator